MIGSMPNKEGNNINENRGLAVTLDELIYQQSYLPYLSFSQNKLTSQHAGNTQSAFKGRGIEFEEVRAYNYGDDVRDIDWRVTARRGETYTKVFREEKDREIVVVLDLSSSMVFGTRNELKSVTAAKTAALIGWLTHKYKDRFGLLLFDGKDTTYFKPQNDIVNLMHIFHKIVQKTHDVLINQYDNDVGAALDMLQYHQKGQGTVFILSDFHNFGPDRFDKVAILSKKHDVCCVNIYDVLEESAPQNGVYAAQYATQKTVFDTGTEGFTAKYQQYFHQQRELLRRNCQKFLCGYIEIRTDIPIFKQLSRI
ncbi:MAG: DUF58 domain-containing protein [Alphaproteobacteria bacterium]|nr:DUF58 domain-containing protein [Alphaproteobacteria bacterium]